MKLRKIAACVAVPSLAFSLVSCGEDAVSKEQFSQGYLKLVKQSQKIHGKQQEEYVIRFGECIYDKIKDKYGEATSQMITEDGLTSYIYSFSDRPAALVFEVDQENRVRKIHCRQEV